MWKPGDKWFVVDVQKLCIDSGWRDVGEAAERAQALARVTSPGAVKVMTKPRVGALVLDPKDPASWSPKRNNPRFGNPAPGVPENAPTPGDFARARGDRTNTVYEITSVSKKGIMLRDTKTDDLVKVSFEEFNQKYRRENPSGLVRTPREERLWKEAKRAAEREGRGGDYAYITGIFKRMRDRTGGTRSNPFDAGGEDDREPWRYRRTSGYVPCACTTCMETAISNDVNIPAFCHECRDAGCDGVHECRCDRLEENPAELLIVNPDGDLDSKRAEKTYAMWHQKEPQHIDVKRNGVDWGDEMVCIGHAFDIVYRSGKWEHGKKTNDYVHTFDSKPKVWMLAKFFDDDMGAIKTVSQLCASCCNRDGQFSCADLARPISFGLDDGSDGESALKINSGARVYGGVDHKTIVIHDPKWKIIVVKGGQMHFDERGIIK